VRCPRPSIKFLNVKASKSSDLSEEHCLISGLNLGDTQVMIVGLILTYGKELLLLTSSILEKDEGVVETATYLERNQIIRLIESDPARFIDTIENFLLEPSPLLKVAAPAV
jgi:hypothetical protein